MNNSRRRSIQVIGLTLVMLLSSTMAVSILRWPNSRRTQVAKAVGRYHAYKKTEQFFQRASVSSVKKSSR